MPRIGKQRVSKSMCLDCKTTRSTYGNEPGKPMYCAGCAHKRPSEKLRDVKNQRCADCKIKQPIFGTEPKKPIYCFGCARNKPDLKLYDVKNPRCADCKIKQPTYGTEPNKPIYCFGCSMKRPDEKRWDVRSKRCADCKETRPNYGTELGKAIYCSVCAKLRPDEMLRDVMTQRCADCKQKKPIYGTKPGSAIYCVKCAEKRPTENLYDVKNPRCADCKSKQPTYGTELGKAIYCYGCAKIRPEEMLRDVKHKLCVTPHCTTTVSNKAYKGHCYRCFINTFPDNQIVRNHKTKERAVADFIRTSYPDYTIAFDKRVADGCSRRRPDILVDMAEYVVVVEIDENQHDSYDCSCENKRMMEIFQDAGSRPLVIVRFNPDQYYNKHKKSVASCWGYTTEMGLSTVKANKATEWATRLTTLKTTLDMVFLQGTSKEIDVYHLYYDGF